MGVIAGNLIHVDGANTVAAWKVRYKGQLADYRGSNTQSGVGRELGNSDWRGIYRAYGHTPLYFPGETFTFTGTVDGTNGATGAAICDRIRVWWDIEQGKKIQHEVSFSAMGALTLGAAAASDSTSPDPPTSKGMFIKLNGTAQTDIRRMELIVVAGNKPYVSSTTDGVTKRAVGPIDATLNFSLYQDDPSLLPSVALDYGYVASLYVTSTTYWELAWMMCDDIDYGGDHEGEENVGGTVGMSFNGFSGTTAGWIKTPAGTAKWPAA